MKCPCYSNLEYEECCARYHKDKSAPTPLALMRSRFSAYALRLVEYIIGTTYPTSREESRPFSRWKQEIAQFSDKVSFDGLDILEFQEDGDIGFVTFKAHLSQGDKDLSFTEKSRFERKEGFWYYVDAVRLTKE